jgi:hypothetical protein
MEVPPHAWHTIGADIFHYKGKLFLIMSDYFSKMPFVRQVPSTAATASIKAMKGVFSENGIPQKLVSDNNPFNSFEFQAFAVKYGFSIVSSSPEYPRGHGLIERHIQTIKKCMLKCDHSGQDFELALLSLRATPLDSNVPSPGELLNGRKLRTTLPAVNSEYVPTGVSEHLEARQRAAKGTYDRHVRQKKDLAVDQPVRVFNQQSRRWDPAVVTGFADTPRSYIVQRGEGSRPLRRNRQHIKETREIWQNGVPPADPMENFDPVLEDSDPTPELPPADIVEAPRDVERALPPETTEEPRYPRRQRNKPIRYR